MQGGRSLSVTAHLCRCYRPLLRRRFSSTITNYDRYLTNVSLARRPSPVREITPLASLPGMISLGSGLPNPSLFPFKHLSFHVPIDPLAADVSNSSNLTEISLTSSELNTALQYSPTPGLPDLVSLLKQYHILVHSPPLAPNASNTNSSIVTNDQNEFDLVVSTGSQDLVTRALTELLHLDRDDPDTLLMEAPTYSGTLAFVRPLQESGHLRCVGVPVDANGVLPGRLEDAVKACIAATGRAPKCFYCVPTGQNPSGATYAMDRKREVYDICSKYDMILIEDDPYHALQFGDFGKYESGPGALEKFVETRQDEKKFDEETKSLQSLDTEGRVLRFDSLSKVMSSGLRLGYVSGAKRLVGQIGLNCQATHLHTSGVSQMMLLKLLQLWGPQGMKRHCLRVAYEYMLRRDAMERVLQRVLREESEDMKSVVKWETPRAGMFYWLDLEMCYDKENPQEKIKDTERLIKERAREYKVLMLPGKAFYLEESLSGGMCSNVRVGYSVATEEDMLEGIRRFKKLLA